MRLKRALVVWSWILLFSISFLSAQTPGPAAVKAQAAIRWQDVYDYCRNLASERFGGRYTGDEKYLAMAQWAASKFKEWGLKPISQKDGYLQAFPNPYTIVDKAELTLLIPEKKPEDRGRGDRGEAARKEVSIGSALQEARLALEADFLPYLSTDSGSGTVDIVFCGWGISAPDLGYDDYAGMDVKGKAVLIFPGTPDSSNERFAEVRRKVMNIAKEKGAVAVLAITNPIGHPNSGNWVQGITCAMISEKNGDALLEEKGIKSADLRRDLELYKRPLSFALKSKARYAVESRHFADGIGRNIIGFVEGSDPKLKEECVVVGAHVDHVGRIGSLLFPGADDNASGSAVVMLIGETFARMARKPRRPVVFALFGGEEFGILGSQHMAKNLPAPFKRVDLMINFDMVGEGDGARASVSSKPEGLKAYVEGANSAVKIVRGDVRTNDPQRIGGTDHTAFAVLLKCPVASFGSNGPHLSYHLSGDQVYRVNPDIMADIARVAFLTAADWADR